MISIIFYWTFIFWVLKSLYPYIIFVCFPSLLHGVKKNTILNFVSITDSVKSKNSIARRIRALEGRIIANLRIKSVASDSMEPFLLFNFKRFIFCICNLFRLNHFSRTCKCYCWICLNKLNLHIERSCDCDISSTFTFVTVESDEKD